MQEILLLEDDAALGSGIFLALQSQEVQITLCTTLEQARRALSLNPFDLLIMNRMLDAAMQGDFTEDSFDETLEGRIVYFLPAMATAGGWIAALWRRACRA